MHILSERRSKKFSRGGNLNDGGEKKMSNGGENMFKVQCRPARKKMFKAKIEQFSPLESELFIYTCHCI